MSKRPIKNESFNLKNNLNVGKNETVPYLQFNLVYYNALRFIYWVFTRVEAQSFPIQNNDKTQQKFIEIKVLLEKNRKKTHTGTKTESG